MNLTISRFLERGNPELQDRLEVMPLQGKTVFAIADGAGGRSGAVEAAEFLVSSARAAAASLISAESCYQALLGADRGIAQAADCGETTGIIVVVSPDRVVGGNVGDSAAWLFAFGAKEELSRVRKPYLGSGVAAPHQFAREWNQGTVVIASDGLWKYTSLELIEQRVQTANPERLAAELADLVRLRSGTFPDDIAIATCRLE